MYKYIKTKTNNKHEIPFSIQSGSKRYDTDLDIANAFNKYFQSVFITSSKIDFVNNRFEIFKPFTQSELKFCLKKFRNSCSGGPNGIPVTFLKNLNQKLFDILLVIFNQFMKFNYIPGEWKTALVTPVYKKSWRYRQR